MKIQEWVKIGEVVKSATFFQTGLYAQYAVMEFIYPNGTREYEEILMCTWSEQHSIKSQESHEQEKR